MRSISLLLLLLLVSVATSFRATTPWVEPRAPQLTRSQSFWISMQAPPGGEPDEAEAERIKKQVELGASETYVEPPNPALYGGILAIVAIVLLGKDML